MLTAVRGNREAKIDEDQREEYLKEGYDIIDGNGNRTVSPSKKVAYAEYAAILAENASLKTEVAKLKAKLEENSESKESKKK